MYIYLISICYVYIINVNNYIACTNNLKEYARIKDSDYEPVCNMSYQWVNISSLYNIDTKGITTFIPTVVSDITTENKLIKQLMCESSGPCAGIDESYDSYCTTVTAPANIVVSENRTVKTISVILSVACQCMIKLK